MRLQIDSRIGRRIMEYVWPARREREHTDDIEAFETLMESPITEEPIGIVVIPESPMSPRRSSWDVSPRTRESHHHTAPASPLRRIGTSRSFTDLRKARTDSLLSPTPTLHKTRSTDGLAQEAHHPTRQNSKSGGNTKERLLAPGKRKDIDDATEMKTRSSQKTFIWVRVNRYVNRIFFNESRIIYDISLVSICCSVSQRRIPSCVEMLGSAREILNIATRPGVYVCH